MPWCWKQKTQSQILLKVINWQKLVPFFEKIENRRLSFLFQFLHFGVQLLSCECVGVDVCFGEGTHCVGLALTPNSLVFKGQQSTSLLFDILLNWLQPIVQKKRQKRDNKESISPFVSSLRTKVTTIFGCRMFCRMPCCTAKALSGCTIDAKWTPKICLLMGGLLRNMWRGSHLSCLCVYWWYSETMCTCRFSPVQSQPQHDLRTS